MDWIMLAGAGVLATLVMDVIAWVRFRIWGITALDYALVGRWIGHLFYGRLRHKTILTSPAIKGERGLGWLAHYAIGAGLAVGLGWFVEPKAALVPSVTLHIGYGIASVFIPFLVMMPSFGFGYFARNTPNPVLACWRSLIAHGSFGFGLYVSVLTVTVFRTLPGFLLI